MAFRDLVMGGAGCAAPGMRPSTSNPLSGLADSLLGTSAKTQERVRELPGMAGPSGESSIAAQLQNPSFQSLLPGDEAQASSLQGPSNFANEFLEQFHGQNNQFNSAWQDSSQMQVMPPQFRPQMTQDPRQFDEFEKIYAQNTAIQGPPLPFHEAQEILSQTLHGFLTSARSNQPVLPAMPNLNLSEADKMRVRNRASIIGRHLFAERGEEFVNTQVSSLLQSLRIADVARPAVSHMPAFEGAWREASGQPVSSRQVGESWAGEFGPSGWAEEFKLDSEQKAREAWSSGNGNFLESSEQAVARQQTQRIVDTLSQDSNPKIQNSKFLQFMSKMSRGDVVMDGKLVKEVNQGQWASEFDQLHGHSAEDAENWASQFAQSQLPQGSWAQEFIQGGSERPSADQWAAEFQGGDADWAREFSEQFTAHGGDTETADWLNSYNQFVEEQETTEAMAGSSVYQFASQNPYVGQADTMQKGVELFKSGLLSEAVLALEAEVLKSEANGEAWKLLGITHAENDDDKQAILAMARARNADPTNLDVLLALGVSHTNELDQSEALNYLCQWLQNHPKYSAIIGDRAANSMTHSEVIDTFLEVSRQFPGDPQVLTVLGVLFNLSREYERAIEAFKQAVQLDAGDHSLWNKLGATQANSTKNSLAIQAYQKALDLKPNYVRAWSNMGIGFANQGRYEDSIRYYVRALSMNPGAENAWQYLRISLNCCGRTDLLEACDRHELEPLQREYRI